MKRPRAIREEGPAAMRRASRSLNVKIVGHQIDRKVFLLAAGSSVDILYE